MLRQFQRQSLGLMDMSTDGRLLLLHQYLRERSPAGARLERLHVIDEPSGREIAALTLESAQLRTMLFLPSGHQVLVSGSLVEPAAGRGFLLWDPRSGKSRVLGGLDPDDFTFIQFLDAARILGKRSETKGGNPHVLYDLSSETTVPFDIRASEAYNSSMWERGLTLSPDRRTVVGQEHTTLTFRQLGSDAPPRRLEITSGGTRSFLYSGIRSYLYSPDGKLFIVISKAVAGEEEGTAYLSVYETENLQRVLHQPILAGEAAGPRGLGHVGDQLGISPDGQWLVVGFDRLTTQFLFFDFSEARYAVYELRSGRHVGTVEHPRIKMASEWAAVSPAQSGRLRFGPDGQSFYTTSEFTRQWQLPGQ